MGQGAPGGVQVRVADAGGLEGLRPGGAEHGGRGRKGKELVEGGEGEGVGVEEDDLGGRGCFEGEGEKTRGAEVRSKRGVKGGGGGAGFSSTPDLGVLHQRHARPSREGDVHPRGVLPLLLGRAHANDLEGDEKTSVEEKGGTSKRGARASGL